MPKHLLRLAACSLALFQLLRAAGADSINYNRDIRPVLSENCFHCHGPDQKARKGKFRLDVREDAVGKHAIVPGKPKESELVGRIFAMNPDDVMPPAESRRTLTPAQKSLLRRWIADGAKYEKHWAYIPPAKAPTPPNRNPIDALVSARWHKLGLKPSPPADRRTLARRLYFDLVGLPPRPEEVGAFVQDKSPEAVSRLIERLLATPQFGERMAIGWLDVARYADTIGYHSDNPRNVWPYRDYVIQSLNENKPFDQFTREQLAGDLLPDCTREQKVGSAFNRLLLSTEEGGAQPKDYEARMLTDRVRAVSAVWLGQTIGCAQCHDHKFDPIKQRDFYSLGAFFADIEEPIIGAREAGMLLPDEKQAAELKRLQETLAAAQKNLDTPRPEWLAAYAEWQTVQTEAARQESRWTALTPAQASSTNGSKLKIQSDHSVLVHGKHPKTDAYTLTFTNALENVVGLRLEALLDDSLPAKGPGRAKDGSFVLTEVRGEIGGLDESTEAVEFGSARADFEQDGPAWKSAAMIHPDPDAPTNGWAIFPQTNQPHQVVLALSTPLTLSPGEELTLELKQNNLDHALGHFRINVTTNAEALTGPLRFPPPPEFAKLLLIPAEKRDAKQREQLYSHFKEVAPETAQARKQLADAQKTKDDFAATVPHCLVSNTNEHPRTVRILPRGDFLNESGDVVQPALPAYLVRGANRAEGPRLNRLNLADWLISRDNPLTARVVMNRLWKQFFGLGLSRVVDDLGAQGELPPNQPLLDWLACEFMDSGWDLKHMVRLIVNSHVYQQSSLASARLRARDPLNRELAVQSRWRLDAELVRDNALAVSGLLQDKIGGASVFPYQPDGYWDNLNFPERTYDASKGPDQYRRGLYTWWQRSYLHPSLVAFDAPTREECAADRNRSNIPQQALVLLNDPTYVEAARALAARILEEGGAGTQARLTWAWRQVLARAPRPDEIKTIELLLEKLEGQYRDDPEAARSFIRIGEMPAPRDAEPSELAAWTNIARVLLNLHETITRS
jgi:hypothetical protein